MPTSQVSLAEMLPTNGNIPDGDIFVVLKSYFDGGNKADSRQYDIVSLAVGSGGISEWEPFEEDWRGMLTRHHADYLHTTDAVARQNHYDGWTEGEADSFLRDCARIIEKHFIRLNTEYVRGQYGLYCFVVSIKLKDFVSHLEADPEAPRDANEGCFRQAIGDVLLWATNQAACDEIHCFFDQGEPFYGYLVNLLNSKKAKTDAWLLNKITSRTETDSRLTPALQFADMFAWVESHKDNPWNPEWKMRILRLPYLRERLDSTNLHDVNHAHRAAWNTWKIPKRAPTK